MAVNGPIGMYKVRALYDLAPDINLPTCMYKMNNLMKENSEVAKPDEVRLLEAEKNQQNILKKLEDLKKRVSKLKEELNVCSEKVKKPLEKFQDVVVKANPQTPPLSLWVFYQLLSKSVPVRLVTYVHCSLLTVPESVKMLKNVSNSESCMVSLTVIWKDGAEDHEMVVDPIRQGIIEGEVNIARYISRLLSLDYETDPILSTQIDNWLEVAHSSVIHGNNKEQQAALRSLNSHLGKSEYLVGNNQTIADIVMWSAIVQNKLHESLPANVTKWFKSLLNNEAFSLVAAMVSV